MTELKIERVRSVLWVTVICPVSKSKGASASADKAARKWVQENKGYRQAFRRSSSQTSGAKGFHYRAAFALH
jgi:hypothetical protein